MIEIPKEKGNYIILYKLLSMSIIQIPKFGNVALQAGYYLYCGSALGSGGLKSRIMRHTSRIKKLFWHIDYLNQWLKPIEVWYQLSSENNECLILQTLRDKFGGKLPIKGFGSSDCKKKCGSHLIKFCLNTNPDNLYSEVRFIFPEMERVSL